MTDQNPPPSSAAGVPDPFAGRPAEQAPDTAVTESPDPATQADEPKARPARPRWRSRQVPLLGAGGALLLGFVLGAGVVAVGAFAAGDRDHGGDRSHGDGRAFGGDRNRYDNPGDRGQGRSQGQDDDSSSQPATPAPTATASPSASPSGV